MKIGNWIEMDDGVFVVVLVIIFVAGLFTTAMVLHNQKQEAADKARNERELGFAKAGLSKVGEDIWIKVTATEVKAEIPR